MMNLKTEAQRRIQASVRGWQSFWFSPELAYTLGIVRIAFGALMIIWTLWMFRGLSVGMGQRGVIPKPPERPFIWGVFHSFTSDEALLFGWFVLLGAAIALCVGWHSRLAAILVFVLVLSLERRNPAIFNGGDALLRIEALFIALAPCGAALSLDQRRRTGSFFSAQAISPWALRLLQVQLSIVYLSTVVMKLGGETWQNGTAVHYSLNQHDLHSVVASSWITQNLLLSNALTWGTLVIEIALGVLVWNRRWRPWVLAGGVILHLSISMTIQVGFFTWVTFILYLAFIPPERAEAIAKGVQRRLTSRPRGDDAGSESASDHSDDAQPSGADAFHPDLPEFDVSPERISAAFEAVSAKTQAPVEGERELTTASVNGGLTPAATTARAILGDEEPVGRHGRHARHALK